MTRVALVTGGAGFIGSHLCGRLLEEGYRVVCVDNFATGRPDNVLQLEDHPRFELVAHDITAPLRAHEAPSLVFHLASPASPRQYLRLPVETLEVGSLGTKHALEIARRGGARFVFASTSEVYGDPQVSPQPESYRGNVSTTGPRSVYDEAKRFGEALTMAYHRSRGVDTRIARIFNTFGPRLTPDDGRAVSTFIRQALAAEPLTVYGDGTQTRSFCYVSDLVEGLLALARSDYRRPVNLGSPDDRTILEVAQVVKDRTGSASPIEFRPLPEDDPLRRSPDIGVARHVLGWEPTVSFEEGIDRTVEWFKARPAASAVG